MVTWRQQVVVVAVWWLVGVLPGLPVHAEITYLPLPEIVVDPNEGTTAGLLSVVIIADKDKQIREIIAPDVRYNSIFGVYPTLRYFGYPDAKRHYFLSAGKSTEIDEHFEGTYDGQNLLGGYCNVNGQLLRDLDSRERFYGIGNDTSDDDETNYTGDAYGARVTVGLNLPDNLRATTGTRVRRMRVRKGGVGGLPSTLEHFSASEARGADGTTVVGQSVGFWYDTRDLADMPSEGSLLGANFEVVDRALGSSVSFGRIFVEGRSFQPLRRDKKIILAVRGFAEYLVGGDRAPFYELSSLGGVSSLRSFGSHRYRDNHRLGAQFELRTNVYAREMFGVMAHVELAPFVDVGKVFEFSRAPPFTDLHVVGGIGFRIVVIPQVVAYVDNGYRNGGVATFTGIDYPY